MVGVTILFLYYPVLLRLINTGIGVFYICLYWYRCPCAFLKENVILQCLQFFQKKLQAILKRYFENT